MKAILYARVSRSNSECRACGKEFKQEGAVCPSCGSTDVVRLQDTENQLILLREFAAKNDYTVAKEYVDRVSGGTGEREQFQAMFADLKRTKGRRGKVILLFYALDRLSREGPLKTLQYLQELNNLDCDWRSYTEQYLDSTGIFREAIVAILAALAKQERVRIAERTVAGLERARLNGTRSGKPIGRPRTFDREKALALYEEHKSFRKVAELMGEPYTTVRVAVTGRGAIKKKAKKRDLGEPVWGVLDELGVFKEQDGGTVVVRFDNQTGQPWCMNHKTLLNECREAQHA